MIIRLGRTMLQVLSLGIQITKNSKLAQQAFQNLANEVQVIPGRHRVGA